MTDLNCTACGVLVAHVTDTRFGLMPAAAMCRACSLPAFAPKTAPT